MPTNTRKIDVQDELAAGFEPSPHPPVRRDGSLELPVLRAALPSPPRICEYGPCARYHCFKTQMDVESPRPVKGADGRLEQPAQDLHFETHHYCYPEPGGGIELELGGLPVTECNRWAPVPVDEDTRDAISLRFAQDTAAWQSEVARLRAELEAGEAAAEADIAAMVSASEPEALHLQVVLWRAHEIQGTRYRVTDVQWTDTVAAVVARALHKITGEVAPDARLFTAHCNGAHLNMAATIAHAGLGTGDVIDIRPTKETIRP